MITEEDIFKMARGEAFAPSLQVKLIAREPILKTRTSTYRPDALLEGSQKRRRWKFLAEFKASATPKVFSSALAAIQPAANEARLLPMIVLPYLSPDNLAYLEEAGVSGIDLCGNGIVAIPNDLLIVRTGQPNLFPRSEPIRNVYRGESSLACRSFLVKPTYGAVGEIVTTIKKNGGNISFATVSKVLNTLEADLIVGRTPKKIELLQADKLLDTLAANYRPPKIIERLVGKVALGERELSKALIDAARQAGATVVLTGATSAPKYSVLAREPVIALYSTATPNDVLAKLGVPFEKTDRFPNVDVIHTLDGPPYFESVADGGVKYASPVQAYIELMSGDKRQRETAEQVRAYVSARIRE